MAQAEPTRFGRWIAAGARDPEDSRSWVAALQALAGPLAKRSWRLYRCAVAWHLGETRGLGFQTAFLLATDAVPKPAERRRRLQRRIDPDTLRVVVEALRARRGRTGGRIADMMVATVATGIRPNEWQTVTRKPPGTLLVVNAKYHPPDGARPGRGDGPVRELLEPEVVGTLTDAAIVRTMEWLRGRPWRPVEPTANRLFRSTVAALIASGVLTPRWRRLRIYDCRHQFAADAKATLDLLAGEVAASMGQASAVTAIAHYGKRQHAKGRSAVRPSAASVQAVNPASIERAREMVARTRAALRRPDTPATGTEARRSRNRSPRGPGPD